MPILSAGAIEDAQHLEKIQSATVASSMWSFRIPTSVYVPFPIHYTSRPFMAHAHAEVAYR